MTQMTDTPRTFSRRDAARLMAMATATLAMPRGALAAPLGRYGPATPFSWALLTNRAQAAARRPYAARPLSHAAVPDFDSHVRLTFGQAEALPGHVRLFPTRLDIAPQAVGINIVENGQARAVIDTHGLFGDKGAADPAGFRVLYPDGHADWLAFLGASYFRAEGGKGQFGLSARGVSIDTGIGHSEEFPDFTDFWIEAKGDDRLIVCCLMDGPSLTGAFEMDTRRQGDGTVQDIRAAIFPRRDIPRLGLAPMTSMFLYGESDARADWRGEVHDSDGLAILTGTGERIWYPLSDPKQPRLNAFRADHVKGFGLLQRDQTFDHYQDDMSYYDRRPSLWVEPQGDWGPGAVTLFAFPSVLETVDNIACWWASDVPTRAGERRDLAYRLSWNSHEPAASANARCINLFTGPGGVPGGNPIPDATRYILDFAGDVLAGLDAGSGVSAVTDLPAAAVLMQAIRPVGGQEHRWRVTLDVKNKAVPHPEFRLFLKRGPGALSETVIVTVKS
jgi:glucans biosynthesis protein